MLLSAPEAARADLSNWKVIIGGSALPRGLAKTAVERGINVFTAYGLSETCPFLTTADLAGVDEVTTDDETIARRCKTGQPTVMVDLRVVDSDMNDLPRDGVSTGEVVVRAPWLTQGYCGSQEGSEALWQGGYMHTGDVGYIDETGSLQITDRMKDIIKSGGEWISSLELEDIVSRCAGVSEVAAIGIKDERWGERPMLLVTRSPAVEDMISEADILKVIHQRVEIGELSKWATPERIEFVSELPRTSVGKLDKKAMRAVYDPIAT
jgi:fatty-acyl-CoA synthase